MPFSARFGSENWKFPYLCRLVPLIIGAFATAHIVSSLRYFWKELKERREQNAKLQAIPSSLYGRVVAGECHHGWKMIMPEKTMPVQRRQSTYWTSQVGFASVEKNNATRLDHVLTSVIDSPLPDGQRVYTLRMWSLVCPEVNATLLRISGSYEDWSAHYSVYLGDSTYGIVFNRADYTRFRIVICSEYRQGHLNIRKYDLQSPIKNAAVASVHLGTKGRLFVLFARYTWDDFEGDEQNAEDHDAESEVLEHVLASYDFRVTDEPDNTIHYPLGYEGISIPTRNRYQLHAFFPVGAGEFIYFLYNGPDATNYLPPLCITYKANRGWTVDTVNVWIQRLRNERDSAEVTMWKILRLMRSFQRLDPPESRCWTVELPSVGKCDQFGSRHGDDFFVFTRDGMFRRRINPPSLKCLAAEALFRSNPTLKGMSRLALKREIGVDVFEGIPEGKESENEVPMIQL